MQCSVWPDKQQLLAVLQCVCPPRPPSVRGSACDACDACRRLAVLKQLRRSENLAAREEAAIVTSQRVMVSAERACSLCHKRIGGAAFVSYPGGPLAHYSCHKRHAGDSRDGLGGSTVELSAGGSGNSLSSASGAGLGGTAKGGGRGGWGAAGAVEGSAWGGDAYGGGRAW